jgi:hypothetical protein
VVEPNSIQQSEITDETRWNLLYRKAQELKVLRAFTLFREHLIEPILIKGVAAARFYPESRPRVSVDMDFAVSTNDFESASAVAKSVASSGLAIDLHCELRHLDTVDWDDLFENSRLLQVDGGTLRVLRPEDHLRVLVVHWLTDGGSSKDRLWDIYFMIENRPRDFDWERFLNSVGPVRRRWLTCSIGLAHRYLGLDLDDTPIEDEARDLPVWLIKAVEREWASDTPYWPLELCLNDPGMFLKQMRKRVPPNPIWATVSMEGSFDARSRVFYQIGNTIKRIIPSYRRVSGTLMNK